MHHEMQCFFDTTEGCAGYTPFVVADLYLDIGGLYVLAGC